MPGPCLRCRRHHGAAGPSRSSSADVLDARGPRPGLSGPPGTDHRSIRGRRGRRCHRPGSCQKAGGGVGSAGDRGEPPGRRQHRGARAGRTCAPRRVHAADQHQRPGIQRRPGRRAAVRPPPGLRSRRCAHQPAVRTRRRAQSGITTIDELAAAASDRPGEIRFASAGTGTGTHLAVAKLNRDLGIAAVHTPPAATDAITDVIAGTAAGHTTYAMLPIPPAAPYLQDGGLVASGSAQRAARARRRTYRRSQRLASSASISRPGTGIWAPAQTPAGIVSALACDIADTLATAELSEWLTQHDADPMRMSPAEFGAFVVSEAERAAVLLPTS